MEDGAPLIAHSPPRTVAPNIAHCKPSGSSASDASSQLNGTRGATNSPRGDQLLDGPRRGAHQLFSRGTRPNFKVGFRRRGDLGNNPLATPQLSGYQQEGLHGGATLGGNSQGCRYPSDSRSSLFLAAPSRVVVRDRRSSSYQRMSTPRNGPGP
jgi:hypothetical protein